MRSDSLEVPTDIEESLKIAVFAGFDWSVSNLRLSALMMLQAFCPLQKVRVPSKVIDAFTQKCSEALTFVICVLRTLTTDDTEQVY